MRILKNALFTFIFILIIVFGSAIISENPKDFLLQPFLWIFFFILFITINIFLIPYQKAISQTSVLQNLETIRKMPKEEYEQRRKLFIKENKKIVYILVCIIFIGLLGLGYTLITKNKGGLWLIFIASCAVIPLVIKFSRDIIRKDE